MSKQSLFDVTIIGGGPVGMFTAFYAGMRQMSCKIIESLPQLGGQLSALYPEKYIYDIAGFPKIKAQDLIDNLKKQMEEFEQTICLGETVNDIRKIEDGTFEITTGKDTHYTKSIIITAGNGAFKPRKLEIEDAEKYEGKNLHYFVTDLNQFKGKRVQLFGGGDSAVDWALMLEPIAEKVTIVHRRDKFRAHEYSVETMRKSSINVMTPYVPSKLIGEDRIEGIVVKKVKDTETQTIDVDDVIVTYGFISSLGPIKEWGLETEKNNIIVNSRMETNIEGIYAVGDVCAYEGKVKLIATGFGEAPIAISNAKVHIDPTATVQPLHSTTIMDESNKKPLKTVK